MKSNKTELSTLKCYNCGSSFFEQVGDGTYKCCHCGSIARDDNAEKKSFMKFLNSKSEEQSRVFVFENMISKKDFFNNAVSHIALSKNSPEDILSASFSDVKIRYNHFLVVNAEFKVATLSNEYFDEVSFSGTKSKKISINTERKMEEDVVSTTMNICAAIDENKDDQCDKIYNEICMRGEGISLKSLTSFEIEKTNIHLPTKQQLSDEIDRVINDTKQELMQARKEKNVRIMHTINKIELYVVPEYYLEYRYKGEKCEVSSFAYNFEIMGYIPNDSENLHRQVLKKTANYPLFSIFVSLLAVAFGLYALLFSRKLVLVWISFIAIPVVFVVFLVTFRIDKILTRRMLLKRYNLKKERLKEFLKNANTGSSKKDEFLSSFEGGK